MGLGDEILSIVRSRRPTFRELVEELVSRGIIVDSAEVRRVVAEMVRLGVVCKEWDSEVKRFRFYPCEEVVQERSG